MKIASYLKLSLIDYPELIASVVFTPGCNFSCHYCHNVDLLQDHHEGVDIELIENHLDKRKGIIDGLVITGGEPTLQDGLIPFIQRIKLRGLKVKLDTNGYNPEQLKQLIKDDLLDYIAMDIKHLPKCYSSIVGCSVDETNILDSIDIIKSSHIEYEFRTTLVKPFHTMDDVLEMAKLLSGSKKYILQNYRYSEKQVNPIKYSPFTLEEMTLLKSKIEVNSDIDEIVLRGST